MAIGEIVPECNLLLHHRRLVAVGSPGEGCRADSNNEGIFVAVSNMEVVQSACCRFPHLRLSLQASRASSAVHIDRSTGKYSYNQMNSKHNHRNSR